MQNRKIIQKKVLLFISSKSRSGESALIAVKEALSKRGHIVLNDNSSDDHDPNKLILKYSDADVVIVGGGDGSVNYVLPSLLKTHIPLLLLPLGTANNLARSLDIPMDIERCLDLLEREPTTIDVGMVNEIPFVNVVGLGLSTEINRLTPTHLKRWMGVGAFILTGLRLILKMNPFIAEISTDDGKKILSSSWQISVCNGKHYGAGMVIKHDANLEDQKLHLLSTEVTRWWKNFSLIPSVIKGRYRSHQEVTLLTAQEFTITTRRKLKIDVDGDIKTETPAVLKVLPHALVLHC